MKIAILGTRGIPNNYGGFEQFAEYLSEGLVNKGHEVFVYNSHNHSYQENKWKAVNIVHCYDPEYLIGTTGQFIYDLNCIVNSRKHNFNIILQLGYTSSSIWNSLMPKNAILVTNMDGIEWRRSKFSSKVRRFLKYAERLALKYSDYLIADSVGIKQYLKQEHKKESTYIPYGAELMNVANKQILAEYNLTPNGYGILVARIEPENNIEMILEGYINSKMEGEFVVVGNLNTPFGKYISQKYHHSKIKYLGFVSSHDKLNSLRYYSNLYFHGHSVGGTNPSLLEAMASNSLICAHENIFNKSILGNDAFYFTNFSEVKLLMDTKMKIHCQELVINNINKIKDLYSWEVVISEYHKFFLDISK